MGQVIGRSTANAGEPATEPVTAKHLVATIMHTLFDVGEVRTARGIPDGGGPRHHRSRTDQGTVLN